MKQMYFAAVAVTLIGSSLLTPGAQAATCSGNGDVVGSYGFVGTREGYFLLGATAPGTTSGPGSGPLIPLAVSPPGTAGMVPIAVTPPGTTLTGSNTPIGNLVTGLVNRNVFTAIGRLLADGAGNLFGANAVGSLTLSTLVGTYTVGTDCSITMTLGDPFVTTVSSTGGVATGGVSSLANQTKLEGVVVQSLAGNELDMVSVSPNAAGAVVTFTRTSQFSACNNSFLSGQFGIVGQGMFNSTAGPGTTGIVTGTGTGGAFTNGATSALGTPFNLLGRIVADGSGNLVNDFATTTSLTKRSLTGTYTVNMDCSGTAHLMDVAGVARNISFLLVNVPAACPAVGSPQSCSRLALEYIFSDPGVFGVGRAKQE